MAGFPEAGKLDEFGHECKSSPLPIPCLLTHLHNKGPGRKKLSGKFLFFSRSAGRLELLYHVIRTWNEDNESLTVNRPPRLCLLAGNLLLYELPIAGAPRW
jgi:hypothetical protein